MSHIHFRSSYQFNNNELDYNLFLYQEKQAHQNDTKFNAIFGRLKLILNELSNNIICI